MIQIQKYKLPGEIEKYERVLIEAWKKSWSYSHEAMWYMWFEREVKNSSKAIVEKEFPEWLEFIGKYRTINSNWSYDKATIRKYKIVLEKFEHEKIMENLELYEKHLKCNPTKPALQVNTYLNRSRFKDNWEIVKTTQSQKWIDDIMKERGFEVEVIDNIMLEVKAWETRQSKEVTVGVLDNLIKYVLTWEL